MKKIKYLFISRISSHYRYYQKLVNWIGPESKLIKLKSVSFPRLSQYKKVTQLDLDELVKVHVERKKVRHVWLAKNQVLLALTNGFYKYLEFCRASYYFKLFRDNDIENVILWNGMKQPNKTPYEVAKACGIKTQLFENGLLPNTTVLDPQGVNAKNSLPRDPDFYLNWKYTGDLDQELSNELVAREPHKNRKVHEQEITLPKRYIFVPFQVPNDTQIICHSPWIKSMEALYAELEALLPSVDESIKFVIKEHPSWPRTYTKLHHKNPKIVFANNNVTKELISNAEAVITINSTVGIEALLLNKKVLTLGDTFLNIKGLVLHCTSTEQLQRAVQNLPHWKCNQSLRSNFLNYLKLEYLVEQSWNNITNFERHVSAIYSRLKVPYESNF